LVFLTFALFFGFLVNFAISRFRVGFYGWVGVLGYAGTRLHFAVSCCAMILVKKKGSYTWIHNHKNELST
jgi:hypothetical protein